VFWIYQVNIQNRFNASSVIVQNNASLSDEPTLPVKPENESLFTCNKEYDTITELALKRFCMFT
jgi:hypothetical protein